VIKPTLHFQQQPPLASNQCGLHGQRAHSGEQEQKLEDCRKPQYPRPKAIRVRVVVLANQQ